MMATGNATMSLRVWTVGRKQRGWVADFCPVCQSVQPHRLMRVEWPYPFWHRVFRLRRLAHTEIECDVCESVQLRRSDHFSASPKEAPQTLDELVRTTNPEVRTRFGRELELAGRTGSLSPAERADSIERRLMALDAEANRIPLRTPYSPSGRVALGIAVACGALMFLVLDGGTASYEGRMYLVLALILTAGAAFLYAVIDAGPLHRRRRLRTLVACALEPIDPSVDELQTALDNLGRVGAGLGRKLRARKLRALLDGPTPIDARGRRRGAA